MRDLTDRSRDFKLVETGFSYWATTLNRVAARLALGRVKEDMAALQRERDEATRPAEGVEGDLAAALRIAGEATARAEKAEGEAKALREALDKIIVITDSGADGALILDIAHIASAALQSQGYDSLHAGES
jgi:hypothetical protein